MAAHSEERMAELAQEIEAVLQDDSLPTLYFNGFINTMGSGDVMLILKRGDKPVAILNTSYTVAKTLSVKLGEMIGTLEQKSRNTIMTTDEINQAVAAEQAE